MIETRLLHFFLAAVRERRAGHTQSTHFPISVIIGSTASPPPNGHWTNIYFFKGGFAVRVPL